MEEYIPTDDDFIGADTTSGSQEQEAPEQEEPQWSKHDKETSLTHFNTIAEYINSIVINRPEYVNLSIISVGCHIAKKMQSKNPFYIIDGKRINLGVHGLKIGSSYSGKSLTDEVWIGGQRVPDGLIDYLGFTGVIRLTTTEAGLIGTQVKDGKDTVIEYGDAHEYDFIAYDEAKAIFNMNNASHSTTLYDSIIGVMNGMASKKLGLTTIEYGTDVTLWLNTQWKHTKGFDFDSGIGNRIGISSKVATLAEKREYTLKHSPFKNNNNGDTTKFDNAIAVMQDMKNKMRVGTIKTLTVDNEERYNNLRSLCVENGFEPEQVDRILAGYSIWAWDGGDTLIILTDDKITAIIKSLILQHDNILHYGDLYPAYEMVGSEYVSIRDVYTELKSSKITWTETKEMLAKLKSLKWIESTERPPKTGGRSTLHYRRVK